VADPRTEYTCPECDADNIRATLAGKLRFHKTNGERCNGSGRAVTQLPPEAPECDDTPETPANSATCSSTSDTGAPQSETPRPTSDTPTNQGKPTSDAETSPTPGEPSPRTVETIPGVDDYAGELGDLAAQQLEAYRAKVNAGLTFDQPAPPLPEPEQPRLFDQPSPAGRAPKVWAETQPMSDLGAEIAHRLKEMFHAYSNRMERNQQQTMGPSEIGTPCDRRIALSLMRYPTVNPGGDNWASFVGTCIHAGLEEMFLWADAGSGRYAPEVRLTFPNKHVPKGTTDLIDRVLLCVVDHKGMGQWSLDKLKSQGPSRTYRVQAHTYAYGAKLRGEDVKHVAIVGWPRDKGSLDDLYVWTEPYDPDIAREALQRVDNIGAQLAGCTDTYGLHNDGCGCPDTVAAAYALPMDNTDCRFCPFYMRGAAKSEGGICNGRN
jgi:hypothetical protein